MSISLCMIVKNEQDNLPRCLDSVKDIVDEMIIVDTGSTDATVDIAKKYGAGVYGFPWNGSFSDARNHSLRKATCDWILLMDADDELDPSAKKDVLALTEKNEADAYFFLTVSYLGEEPGAEIMNNLNIRLLKNHMGYFFSNLIHEQIFTNIMAVNPHAVIMNKDIIVYHYGYLDKNVINKDKRKRNISILEKELQENPGYGFAQFNLGNEYYATGNHIKALEYYEASHRQFDPPQGYSSKLILKLAICYLNLGKYEEALATISEGLGYYDAFTDLVYIKGLVYYAQQKYTQAIRCFEQCAGMGEAPLHLSVIDGCGTYRASYMLGEIYYYMEDYTKAADCFQLSMEQKEEYLPSAKMAMLSFCKNKPGIAALTAFLDRHLRHDNIKRYKVAIEALMEEGYYELALTYIKKCIDIQGGTPEMEYLRGICVLLLKKYKGASSIMKRIPAQSEWYAKAVCIRALCQTLEGKYREAEALLTGDKGITQNNRVQVYSAFNEIVETGEITVLSEDEKASEPYTQIIFELLGLLIDLHAFEAFEKALNLLNAVTDKSVLLKLANLYYRKGCYGLAYKELIRSIKVLDYLTTDGAYLLYRLKTRGYI